MVPLSYYLVLSGFLFACGVAGFLIKRNIITIFMSIELMLNGVNLSFVAFAAHWHVLAGQVFVFFVMVVAAAEAAVGLAIGEVQDVTEDSADRRANRVQDTKRLV